jgi:hypothetical protein
MTASSLRARKSSGVSSVLLLVPPLAMVAAALAMIGAVFARLFIVGGIAPFR